MTAFRLALLSLASAIGFITPAFAAGDPADTARGSCDACLTGSTAPFGPTSHMNYGPVSFSLPPYHPRDASSAVGNLSERQDSFHKQLSPPRLDATIGSPKKDGTSVAKVSLHDGVISIPSRI